MKYRSEIDGLRAIAVVSVILYHAGFRIFKGGFIGVDVFFVISGYLITSILQEELKTDSFSIVRFYERRMRRILPALFFVIVVCLPIAWFCLPQPDMVDFSRSIFAVSIFMSNIFFMKTSTYFDIATEFKPFIHAWSLSVEEQYYVFFPLVLLITWRFWKRSIIFIFTILIIISILSAQYASFYYPSQAFYLLPTRAWELLLGSIIAIYLSRNIINKYPNWLTEFGSYFGITLIITSVFLYDKNTPFPGFYALIPTIGASLIIIFAIPTTVIGRLLSGRLLTFIGLISYSAYLWHQPLFAFSRHIKEGASSISIISTLLIMTLILAYFSWRFIEKPFRVKGTFTRKQVFTFSILGTMLFATAGLGGHFTKGFLKLRITNDQHAILKTAVPSPKRISCHTGGSDYHKVKDACQYFSGKLDWAIIGDSHTVELAYALAEELNKSGSMLKHLSFSDCSPTYGRRVEKNQKFCSQWTDEALQYIINNKDIKNVVVSYRINYHLFGTHEIVYPRFPIEHTDEERLERWDSYIGLLQYLINKNKKVFLVLQAPELPQSIDNLIIKSHHPLGKITGVSRAWWNERSNYCMKRIYQVPRNVTIIDPAIAFCDENQCYAADNGQAYYFDSNHMSIYGARIVAAEIAKFISIH
jgi:peptidoglycan/LPS O-acetylase OafA/YrhL